MNRVTYLESWLTWMHSSRHWCQTWSPPCRCQLLRRSWGTISLWWVAVRLISSWSWRWSFSRRFQRSSASAFRSCVACHLCLQNFSRPSTKYMFFVGDVAGHLQIGLTINKIYTKAKRKLRFSKTLYWFVLFWGWSKLRDAKEKSRENRKYSQTQY
jgi:hypothetical protein